MPADVVRGPLIEDTVVIPYRDAGGHLQELRISLATARAIRSIERGARREEERWRARHVTFTDAGVDDAAGAETRGKRVDLGNPWDGPRFSFPLLLGESPTWSGFLSLWILDENGLYACRFCSHYRRMPESAYCLNCDRSGRERFIPAVTEADLRRRTRQMEARDGALKGGKA